MENTYIISNSNNSSHRNNKLLYNNIYKHKHSPLKMSRSHSMSELFSYKKPNEIENITKISKKNKPIPEQRIEEYINEYYNIIYSNYLSNKEKYINNNEINPSKRTSKSIFSDLALSPIDNIPSPNINEKKNKNYKNNYKCCTIDNKYDIKNINIPDDSYIEYNNKKRMMELRNKYLANSSLLFLKNKNEDYKSNNNENNLKNHISKLEKKNE